jgi:uncharacterized protein YciI
MPQYVITAHDGTDADALSRRMAVREKHLANVAPLVEAKHLIAGGAILDESGKMIGSVTIVDFPDRAALDAWLNNDPYVTGKVWQKIDIKPFRLAVLAKA